MPDRVTVIIAVRNGRSTLRRCLDSILEQDYPDKEIVVIDGGSTDGTVAILHEYSPRLAYWESAPDRGIYHAWNKGLPRAKGDWITFLGCDDAYASNDSLSSLIGLAKRGEFDFVSGRGLFVNQKREPCAEFGGPWEWNMGIRRFGICHSGSVYAAELFRRLGGFSELYRICSDYEFNLRVGPKCKSGFLGQVVVHVGDSGISQRQRIRGYFERTLIQARDPRVGPMTTVGTLFLAVGRLVRRKLAGEI